MTFEFNGEKYAKASPHQKEWGRKIISEFELNGDERILDIGCGDGALTDQLANLVPNGIAIGIDASQGMIEASKKHNRHNLKFELMDINRMNFKDEFDIVFSNATLHWIKDHKKLLTKVFSILKIGGIIRFNFAGEGNCSYFFRVIRDVIGLHEYAIYFNKFVWPWYMPSINEYKTLLNQFAFKEAKVWGENADRYFPNAKAMIRWIDQPSIIPFLKCINGTEKERFRNIVVERMIRETKQNDGTCFETFRRINVFARR